jgi:uncharacterized membrane protein HdeD (DUF308 family)
MALNIRLTPERAEALTSDFREDYRKLFVLQGVGLLVLGIAAAALPHLVPLAIAGLIGWLLFIAGLFRFGAMAGAFGAPGYSSSMLVAAGAIVFGTVLVLLPSEGIPTLVTLLTAYLLLDGCAQLVLGPSLRPITRNWRWGRVAALIDFSLILFVFFGWPARTNGLLGLYLGIDFFFGGVALIFAAIGLRMADGMLERVP